MADESKYCENKTRNVLVNERVGKKANALIDNRKEVLQPKWLDNGSDVYRWDVPVSGVQWYFVKHSNKMYYKVISPRGEKYAKMSGEGNAKPREYWVALYGSDPLKHQSGRVIPEDEVFTDSEDELSEDDYDGLRLTGKGGDKAEFDRIKLRRRKIYEDKLATFDQSTIPEKYRKPEAEMIASWIKKQVLGKVTSKLTAIGDISSGHLTVRCHEKTGESPEVLLNWFQGTNHIKIVVFGESLELRGQLEAAILKLRMKFPGWRITAKMGDPVAREDHDRMHGKGPE